MIDTTTDNEPEYLASYVPFLSCHPDFMLLRYAPMESILLFGGSTVGTIDMDKSEKKGK